jgi:hypothetical protein
VPRPVDFRHSDSPALMASIRWSFLHNPVSAEIAQERNLVKSLARIFFFTLIASTPLTAVSSEDTGQIVELFATTTGAIAIRLSNNFANAAAANECTASNGWAGAAETANPILKATLLTAKASGQTIRVAITGCEGGWWKIVAVYVQ